MVENPIKIDDLGAPLFFGPIYPGMFPLPRMPVTTRIFHDFPRLGMFQPKPSRLPLFSLSGGSIPIYIIHIHVVKNIFVILYMFIKLFIYIHIYI